MSSSNQHSPDTLLAQAMHYLDPVDGGIVPGIRMAATYARDRDYELRAPGVSYGRDKNPTYLLAEELVTKLEGGAGALLFSSGLAAAAALFHTLEPGDHVVAPVVMYHGLRDWLIRFCGTWKVDIDYFDASQPGALEAAIEPGRTRLVWIETPSNPTWELTDIAAAARLAHAAGARLAVDSTVATPLLTKPIALGADFVFHSATKYLNGHSDVIAGVLVAKEDDAQWEAVRFQRAFGGAVLGPMEAWLLLRGMRTMHLRVRRACESAMRIARALEGHNAVERVLYPGLESHPGHDIARRQMHGGFGGMLSILVDGDDAAARAVATRTRVFVPATSLGGVESLIEHRASVEGPHSPVAPNLLRLSVGIEDVDDLIGDLEQALSRPDRG
ncbi:MAG: aminotransferase class V-fold PLP-dependent enzyme [Gammaproteobacteria bacterium]|nr:aminotransferase class V-fold PLP-dependent enzyme [Gammaproteobacteria bacterium]NIM71964.1 aminotransferase class V-fold PLP-dependent enzyme [Gammaproteobacteria bacterium]NIN38151.1 aminotransferase class V-fold PLP-dependent enzyme [Gammaproteobacteria bacterium]NIO25575.1 aminotransferase class V-fold PLP-dependent enzyme [Gammaproteobacteria bacterium]NIO64334.1 aminotransferase class V-fold PLP-dependent enzyme [Gammaproteobacteria bacterium]